MKSCTDLKKEAKYLIELPDDEYRIVTSVELAEIIDSAEKFDGFGGHRVVTELPFPAGMPEHLLQKARFALSMAYLQDLDRTRRTLERLHEKPFVREALRIAAGLDDFNG